MSFKDLKGVAEVAAQIMAEQLKGNQKKIDKNHNNKIDGQDFAILRGEKKMKEDVEQIDELSKDTYKSYLDKSKGEVKKALGRRQSGGNEVGPKTFIPSTSRYAEPNTARRGVNTSKARIHAVKKLREDVEQIDEGVYSHDVERAFPASGVKTGVSAPKGTSTMPKDKQKAKGQPAGALRKEEVELEEGIEDRLEAARAKAKAAGKPIKDKPAAPKSNVRKIEGHAYGGAKQKDEPEEDDDDTPAKKTVKYGARQNFVRSKRVNESFTEMLSAYREEGLKFVADTLVVEEPTEEEFNAEIKKAQDKSEGKDKAEVAKASVQAVKNEEVEVIDADQINGVEEITIDERHMTDSEMNKREKIVKSMKKGLSGFKQRYGDRAKNVMYATATKQAMKD